MSEKKIVIIGGGAAGMAAALFICKNKKNGSDVTIIEKNAKTGLKLGITGKGRCNLTNACDNDTFFENIIHGAKFMRSSYSAFTSWDTMDFFENYLSIPLKTERGNRVFPQSDRALDIVNALRDKLRELKVNIINCTCRNIIKKDDGSFEILLEGKQTTAADFVVVATGGLSYPKTGSTGDGYRFAKKFGHNVTCLQPCLVGLDIKEQNFCCSLSGLSLKNVTLTLYKNNKKIYSDLGEMLFTHKGVSGPLVLKASGYIEKETAENFSIEINLKPALDENKLDARLLREFGAEPNKNISNIMPRLLPHAMVVPILEISGIDTQIKANSVTAKMRKSLEKSISQLTLHVKSLGTFDEAVVTAGGVDTKEINPKTMESKLCDNLYFAGEVIDVHGFTGGFNLQVAFSTAHAAALDIVKKF